ncbi:potassium transporter Kef [Secundilactobacillus oryzae JCM 18671]|uniref:Potassium transporter Kef n=2 Tax=Secundilactobacillus oryzae TaxID=1202668 RepID=A0A081BIE9_9LACO|nr:potassium channel family protein [Secundilactobacillus oryzae]GAK47817.1 potassium transporter Kef [Secundilactobacillus oryzae JCM 18671]
MTRKKAIQITAYHWGVMILTLASMINVALIMAHVGNWHVEMKIAAGLTFVFAVDYSIRLIVAKSKKTFLIHAAFDLLGIIPMHPGFVIFRLAHLVRIVRYYHLFWHLGVAGKWTKNFHRFVYDTGFIYLFTMSVAIITLSALGFSIAEHRSLPQALWWAIVTSTTVGYGDLTPQTAWGKMIAIVLMLGGVAFIGLLTSTITDYFTSEATTQTDRDAQSNHDLLVQLTCQVADLNQEVTNLKNEIKKDQHP